jgi:hypothetical protein
LKVAARLSDILERETSSHISLSSFVDHYLRMLDFPSDVIEALGNGEINLFEASQLARITPQRLNSTLSQAKRTRIELLSAHLQTKESGPRACASASTNYFMLQQMKQEGLKMLI